MTRPFSTLLIANRGEIACRIIATARAMGLTAVAVFSDADRSARHVAMADRALPIGGADPTESYLSTDAILAAAQTSGAEAIHPGYGFLSENADFAEAVERAGLIFVGPTPDAIRAMGSKGAAKALMDKAGVPVVPGYHGPEQSDDRLSQAADEIGYPVLIKAVAGGGGKGMRAVDRPEHLTKALASARAEARAAFGDDTLLIEKLIHSPRHIEVQVFGDGDNVVHLFERDCSLQRRHQKVIEEAPAPGLTPEMRAAMTDAATTAARAIAYRGAGTVEFIVDARDGLRPDRFWFMEMNTRLQVEHPVTEAITGIDLVEWQLRVAAGEPLPRTQNGIAATGHAVEARLYAEDVAAGFLPMAGPLTHVAFPDGVRIDTGVRTGDTVSPWFDPMIAKLTAHAPDRATAIAKLTRALDQTQIVGTPTNTRYLSRLLTDGAVRAGDLDTGLIARTFDHLAPDPAPTTEAQAIAAAAALDLTDDPHRGFALWAPLAHTVTLDGTPVKASVGPDHVTVTLPGGPVTVADTPGGWSVNGHGTDLHPVRTGDTITVFGPGGGTFTLTDPLDRNATVTATDQVTAPMPGRLTALMVKDGDTVDIGQPLATLEAMKMEHTLTAPKAGRVTNLTGDVGAQIDKGTCLMVIKEAS